MNSELVQDLRYKLQKRVRRLNAATSDRYRYLEYLRQFKDFIDNNELLSGVVEDLTLRYGDQTEVAAEVIEEQEPDFRGLSEGEQAAAAYFIILRCLEAEDDDIIWRTGLKLASTNKGNMQARQETFHYLLVEPLYEYIDEHLDDQRAILALLRRFKHKCEWFRREELYDLYKDESQRGEKKLAERLYEYLYDQGLSFSIEPASASGEADLVSVQTGDDPLVADAKIFDPEASKGKHYIATALNQVYIYTQDYNQSFGYMVIFKTCEDDLRLSLSDITQSTPFITHNNKTIFFVVVDIFPHEKSASQRGKLKSYEITEDYLIDVLEEKEAEVSD